MATTYTRYVDPDAAAGGNGTEQRLDTANCAYDSLSAWEAARQAAHTSGDITAATGDDSIEIAVCSSNLDAGGGSADDTACTIDGWTTSPTNYLQIEANSSHGGKWNDNIYRMVKANSELIRPKDDNINIIGIQFSGTASTASVDLMIVQNNSASGVLNVEKCIFKCVVSVGYEAAAIWVSSNTSGFVVNVRNCIAYDFLQGASTGMGINNTGVTLNVYNSTIHNCVNGLRKVSNGPLNAYNVGAASCTTAFNAVSLQVTCSSSTPTFVDESGDDFRLASGDTTWKNLGTQYLSTFQDDILGNFRAGAWDIGAHEQGATTTREVIRYVDPDSAGGNGQIQTLSGTYAAYATLASAISGEACDLTARDYVIRFICSSNLDAGSGTADTTECTVSGFTTDATRYIQIEANSSHGGKWNSNTYRMLQTTSRRASLYLSNAGYIYVRGIQFQYTTYTSSTGNPCLLALVGSTSSFYYEVSGCIFRGNPSWDDVDNTHYGLYDWDTLAKNGSAKVYNNIFYDILNPSNTARALGLSCGTTPTSWHVDVYNNTFHNCHTGIQKSDSSGQTVLSNNNLFKSCTTASSGTHNAGSGYNTTNNASMGYTVTGGAVRDRVSQTFSFVDEDGDDFRLQSSDVGARGYGKNLYDIFTDDIEGNTRPIKYTDDFNRANESPIVDPPWETCLGSTKCDLNTNALKGTVSSGNSRAVYGEDLPNDQYAKITIKSAPSGYYYCSLGVRYTPGASDRNGYIHSSTHQYKVCIQRYDNGTPTHLTDATYTVAVDDVLEVRVIGNKIVIYVNGTEYANTTDDTYASGKAWVSAYSTNIVADDFECGGTWDIGADQYAPTTIGYLGSRGFFIG